MDDKQLLREIAKYHLWYVANYGTSGRGIHIDLLDKVSAATGIPLMPREDAAADEAKRLLLQHFPGEKEV